MRYAMMCSHICTVLSKHTADVLVHAHHQEAEGEAAEADLHMQEG